MNIPLGIVVLVVGMFALPTVRSALKPAIDYLGVILISLAATGLTLVTSWGGTEYEWASPTIVGMAAGSIAALVAFVFVEQRAEPMLPLVAGLLVASTVTGQVISRTGRYRPFPIIGAALLTAGLLALSTLDLSSTYQVMAAFKVLLGVGIGMCMPVPVVVVQSTTAYQDLGMATSGVSFLRTMGSSFGAALFGTIYATRLPARLATAVPPGVDPRLALSVDGVRSLPDQARVPIVAACADSLHVVFLVAVPVGLVALLVALMPKQVPLRDSARLSARASRRRRRPVRPTSWRRSSRWWCATTSAARHPTCWPPPGCRCRWRRRG